MTAALALALIAAAQQAQLQHRVSTPLYICDTRPNNAVPHDCVVVNGIGLKDAIDNEAYEVELKQIIARQTELIERQQERIDWQHRQIGEMNDKLSDLIKKCGATKQ